MNKKIIFGCILAVVIMLSVPCVSSMQQTQVVKNNEKKTADDEFTFVHARFINSKTNESIDKGWNWMLSRIRLGDYFQLLPDGDGSMGGDTLVGWGWSGESYTLYLRAFHFGYSPSKMITIQVTGPNGQDNPINVDFYLRPLFPWF